jgi:GNAT superfamily N-acetyltransferase
VTTLSRAEITIRRYREEDTPAIIELLAASLGGGPTGQRSLDVFHWKHRVNPFGASLMLVAEDDGRIVGFRAFMRWRFTVGDREIAAVRAVDTATHPDHQRRGIFSMLTSAALEDLRHETDLVFNTPNEKSLPGYLKMGWHTVGEVPIRVRMRRPMRVARHRGSLRSGMTTTGPPPMVRADLAAETLRDAEDISVLVRDADADPARIVTPRSVDYLRWRYGDAPFLGYHAIREVHRGKTTGIAIFRVRPRGALWETTLAELIVRRGDSATARRLLGAVTRAARVDHVTCSFATDTAAGRAARRTTWRAPLGMILVAKPLRNIPPPAPEVLGSWSLSLGDLEVF